MTTDITALRPEDRAAVPRFVRSWHEQFDTEPADERDSPTGVFNAAIQVARGFGFGVVTSTVFPEQQIAARIFLREKTGGRVWATPDDP